MNDIRQFCTKAKLISAEVVNTVVRVPRVHLRGSVSRSHSVYCKVRINVYAPSR